MDGLQARGGTLMYDPQFSVFRRPRSNLKSFAKMLMTYGRGRAEQFRLHPTPGSALNFVPPAFCVYLVGLLPVSWWVGWIAFSPLALYALAVLLQAAALLAGGARFLPVLGAIPLIVLTHILYGFGFWKGLFTTLKPDGQRPEVKVVLERIPLGREPADSTKTPPDASK